MENKVSTNKTIICNAVFYQFFGTIFLTMNLSAGGIWARNNDGPLHFDALIAFFTIWYLVILTGRVSFAQFNSALTTVWMFRSEKGHFTRLRYGLPILCAQAFGGLLGGLVVWWLKGEVGYPAIPQLSSLGRACVFEILGSFLLIAVILLVSDPVTKVSDVHGINGAIIGLSLIVTILTTQGVSGAGINPSVAMGLTLIEYFRTGDTSITEHLWVYIVFPIIGAFLALLFHEHSARPTLKILNTDTTLREKYGSQHSIDNLRPVAH